MSSSCTECKGQIVWNLDGIVCCSKCGVVIEDEVFAKISTNKESRDYDPEQFKYTYLPDFQRAAYKRLERRDRGFKDFDKILNSLRTSEELSINLKMRLLRPSKKLLLDINNQEIEYLCKIGGDLCHSVVTYTQNILIDEFIERYKSLHKTGWIHSRTMEDAAFLILHRLLVEKLNEYITKATELSYREKERTTSMISQELAKAFLTTSFIGAVIDSIDDKYPEKTRFLRKRDLPYFMRRDAQRIEKEILKKNRKYKIELIYYDPKRIDSALFNVRKGDLWRLFKMPYCKGEKPVDMLKCVENEVRVKAWMRFSNFLSTLDAEELKQCKKTGLNAACCYVETYLHELNVCQLLLPIYNYCLKQGYKSEVLVLPVSQEKWAKAFGITRQTLFNRIDELKMHEPLLDTKIKYVKQVLA